MMALARVIAVVFVAVVVAVVIVVVILRNRKSPRRRPPPPPPSVPGLASAPSMHNATNAITLCRAPRRDAAAGLAGTTILPNSLACDRGCVFCASVDALQS